MSYLFLILLLLQRFSLIIRRLLTHLKSLSQIKERSELNKNMKGKRKEPIWVTKRIALSLKY